MPIPYANAGELVRDEPIRKGRWEVLLSPQYTLAKNLGFDGSTTAKVNDTWGFGLQIGYNFTKHINRAGYCSWSQPDYQAVVQPAPGNSGLARNISGSLQMNTFGGVLRWDINRYFLARGGVRQQWIDLSSAGLPGCTTFKLDIGFKS